MNIIVTGAGSGLGRAICRALMNDLRHYVIGILKDEKVHPDMSEVHACDLSKSKQIKLLHARICGPDVKRPIDAIINCAGMNILDYLGEMELVDFKKTMAVNVTAIALLSKYFLPELIKTEGTILNILSDASVKPMTASLAYNTSKAAAHMLTLQMARELGRAHDITVFGIAPAKIAGTPMSASVDAQVERIRDWTPDFAQKYHRQNVTMKTDIPVLILADFIRYLFLDKGHHKWLNGCVIPYGG